MVGVAFSGEFLEVGPGSTGPGCGMRSSGQITCEQALVGSAPSAFVRGDTIGVAVDLGSRLVYFRLNGGWVNEPALPGTGYPLGGDGATVFHPALALSEGDVFQFTHGF